MVRNFARMAPFLSFEKSRDAKIPWHLKDAMLVCYNITVLDKEGFNVSRWGCGLRAGLKLGQTRDKIYITKV